MTLAPLFPPNNGFIAVLKKNLMYDRMRSISQVSQLISQIIMSLNDRLFWTVHNLFNCPLYFKKKTNLVLDKVQTHWVS